jgi:protease I
MGISAKKVLMIIASKDFRDEEYQKPRNILEKAGAKITVASSTTNSATGMLGLQVKPDTLIKEVKAVDFDCIVLVGGLGANEYWLDKTVHKLFQDAVKLGKVIAAICISPLTLANAGLLTGKQSTGYSSIIADLKKKNVNYMDKPAVKDGKIVTGRSPGDAEEFGKLVASALSEI